MTDSDSPAMTPKFRYVSVVDRIVVSQVPPKTGPQGLPDLHESQLVTHRLRQSTGHKGDVWSGNLRATADTPSSSE